MQWTGSTKIPKPAGSLPCFLGTSAYFWVWAKWLFAVSVASAGSGVVAANAPIAVSTVDSANATPRIAVSGQALTQVMQPTQASRTKSGICGRGG